MKNIMKLGLLLPCVAFITSCGSSQIGVSISKEVVVAAKSTKTSESYRTMCFNCGLTDGKAVKVTKDYFYVMKSNEKIEPVALISKIYLDTKIGQGWYFDNTIESVELPAIKDKQVQAVSVYVAFAYDSNIDKSDEFYLKGHKVTTTESFFDIK